MLRELSFIPSEQVYKHHSVNPVFQRGIQTLNPVFHSKWAGIQTSQPNPVFHSKWAGIQTSQLTSCLSFQVSRYTNITAYILSFIPSEQVYKHHSYIRYTNMSFIPSEQVYKHHSLHLVFHSKWAVYKHHSLHPVFHSKWAGIQTSQPTSCLSFQVSRYTNITAYILSFIPSEQVYKHHSVHPVFHSKWAGIQTSQPPSCLSFQVSRYTNITA